VISGQELPDRINPMNSEQIRALQAPLKERFRNEPAAALQTLTAAGALDVSRILCQVQPHSGPAVEAGLHPLTGGDGTAACAANMLLEALVGCAGVTLSAVSTALEIPVASGRIEVEGDLDFRGTLGVSREAPVGFTAYRLTITLDTTADDAQLEKLAVLTERYCVVAQSLKGPLVVRIVRTGVGSTP